MKSKEPGEKISTISCALAETAASVAVAATVVGAAATILVRRTRASEATEVRTSTCSECCLTLGFVAKHA